MSRLNRHLLAALASVGLLAFGCGPGPDESRVTAISELEADASNGATLFTANCARCHGEDARGGSAGADLPALANADTARTIEAILTGNLVMPRFGDQLTDQQVADVVAHLKAQ